MSINDLRAITAAAIRNREQQAEEYRLQQKRLAEAREEEEAQKHAVRAQQIVLHCIEMAQECAKNGNYESAVYDIPSNEIELNNRRDSFANQMSAIGGGGYDSRLMAEHEYTLKDGCKVAHKLLLAEGFKVSVHRKSDSIGAPFRYAIVLDWH